MNNSSPKLPTTGDYVAVIASALVPVIALAWGMRSDNPYDYYVFLRVVVCFSAIVFAGISSGYKRENLLVLFGIIGLLYNPFFPVHLDRSRWLLLNSVTIVFFVYGFFFWLAAVRKARSAV